MPVFYAVAASIPDWPVTHGYGADKFCAACREVQEAFDQVPQYGDADDLLTLKGIQVQVTMADLLNT